LGSDNLINEIKEELDKQNQINNEQDGNTVIQDFIQQYARGLRQQMEQLHEESLLSSGNGMYNPYLAESFQQSVYTQSYLPTVDQLTNWLLNPYHFDSELRMVSKYLENNINIYYRSVKHLASTMAFKYELLPCDDNETCLDDKDYVNSYKTCLKTLKKLNIPFQFPNINQTVLSEGVAFYAFQENDKFFTLTRLPTDYCIPVGTWDYGVLFALNLVYFDKAVGMDSITPEFNYAYKKFIEARKAGVKGKELAQYQYLPIMPHMGWCFMHNISNLDMTPPLKGSFKTAMDIPVFLDLTKKRSLADTIKVLIQKVPYDEKSNKFLVEYKQAVELTNMMSKVLPSFIRPITTFCDVEDFNVSQSTQSAEKLQEIGFQAFMESSGLSPTMFGTTDAKNAASLKYSILSDYLFSAPQMYSQFANMVNYILMTKSRTYTWQVNFFGNAYNLEEEISTMSKLVTSNNFPMSTLLAYKYQPFQIEPLLRWEKKRGLKDNLLTPMQMASTMSGKENKNETGRRQLADHELGDAGEITRDYETND